MRNIYCISGLGADERIFQNLHIRNSNMIFLGWPKHSEDDTMSSYATKLSQLIPEENPVLLGVSFGGMLTIEIAQIRPIKKGLIISSAKSTDEKPKLPGLIKWFATSGLVPPFIYTIPHPAMYYYFGTETQQERKLLADIIRSSDGRFNKWASNALLRWKNTEVPNNIVHIHGRKDRLITPENIVADHWIEDGGHMMVYNRAEQVNRIIEQELEGL